jgi:hypothetical protein
MRPRPYRLDTFDGILLALLTLAIAAAAREGKLVSEIGMWALYLSLTSIVIAAFALRNFWRSPFFWASLASGLIAANLTFFATQGFRIAEHSSFSVTAFGVVEILVGGLTLRSLRFIKTTIDAESTPADHK